MVNVQIKLACWQMDLSAQQLMNVQAVYAQMALVRLNYQQDQHVQQPINVKVEIVTMASVR
jgi:hypothetical protein